MASASDKPLCFVIGPIGKDGTDERKHADFLLNGIIRQVLEHPNFGYKVKRADDDADPGMIGDRVVSDIINAKLVIADLTGLNPNAFYELGIRHSTEKPAIHIAKAGTVLPFDNSSHRTIFVDISDWASIEAARHRLGESARSIDAPDFKVSNPITQANATFKMRESADPRDRVLVEVQQKLNSLEIRLRSVSPPTISGLVPWTDAQKIDFIRSAILARFAATSDRSPRAILDAIIDVCEMCDVELNRTNVRSRDNSTEAELHLSNGTRFTVVIPLAPRGSKTSN